MTDLVARLREHARRSEGPVAEELRKMLEEAE